MRAERSRERILELEHQIADLTALSRDLAQSLDAMDDPDRSNEDFERAEVLLAAHPELLIAAR